MHETRRFVEAAAALSQALQARGVPHAFHGNIMLSLLSNDALAEVSLFTGSSILIYPLCPQQMSCIVQGGSSHPFKLVRQALGSSTDFTATSSPWSDRCLLHSKFI